MEKEWMAELGAAAGDLGYGIVSIDGNRIELIARQQGLRITIESMRLSGAVLRSRLVPIPHQSGVSYMQEYEELWRRRG